MNPNHAEPKIVNEIEVLLKKSKGRATPEDLSAETGYELYKIKDALGRLLEIYVARVTMDDNSGALMLRFDYPFVKHGSKSFGEYLQIAGKWLWNAFKKVYKAAIGIVLILYAVIFALLLLFIAMQGRSDDRNGGGVTNLIGGLFRAIFQALSFATWHSAITYSMDGHGRRYRSYQPEENKGKKFITSIFNFVLGPDRPEKDPLDDAKEAAAFIRHNNGILTAGHIVALAGVSYDEAERRLADYAGRFHGELEVSEDGTVIGNFTEMLNKGSKLLEGGKIEYYPDEIEPPYEITGNSTGRNIFIIFLNVFNLIMSAMILNFLMSVGISNIWIGFFLGIFPLIFSALFFIVPLVRVPIVLAKRKQRERNIMRKELIGAFLQSPSAELSLSELINRVRINEAKRNEAAKEMEKIVIDLKGEINIDSNGEPLYSFPRLAKELK